MGKSSPKAPAAPDPVATANAQTASNQQTALYNFGLNNPNYNTPLGSLTYSQTKGAPVIDQAGYDKALAAWQAGGGTTTTPQTYQQWVADQKAADSRFTDEGKYAESARRQYENSNKTATSQGGKPRIEDYTTEGTNPQYTADVKLSPEQQQLYDLSTSQSIDLSKLASMLQGGVAESLKQPIPGDADFNAQANKAQDAYYANQLRMLDPQWEQRQKSLDAKLANQGITMGSEAYNNENNNFARQRQSAYDTAQNNAILAGPQNAQQLFSLSSAARQLPLNEFNALRSQSQVQMPSFQGTNTAAAQPTNTAQIAQNAYQGQQDAYNQQIASNNSTMSGLFSLGGSLGSAYLLSDIHLKTGIKHIGTENGYNIYQFKYLGSDDVYKGVMAQEVPVEATVELPGGWLAVNYGMLGIEMQRVR